MRGGVVLTPERISQRVLSEYFDLRVMDNNLRGYWCEAMVAEALGPDCRVCSGGWAPWDLELGAASKTFPDNIRIQVKNTARVQSWHGPTSVPSDPMFNLSYRSLPEYWNRDNPDRQCEAQGFLCDLFVLCFHGIDALEKADQRDPNQWQVFLISASPRDGDITENEIRSCRKAHLGTGRPSTLQRRPATMAKGIRGRRATVNMTLTDLSGAIIREFVTGQQA